LNLLSIRRNKKCSASGGAFPKFSINRGRPRVHLLALELTSSQFGDLGSRQAQASC
jgi:hypothetical protein